MVQTKLNLVSWGRFGGSPKKRKPTSGERVAVKIYKPEYRDLNDDIPDAVQALKHLRHDNVIRLLGAVRINRDFDGQMAVIMEFAAGGSLEQALQHRRIGDDQHSESIIFQIASGLVYLHDNNIVHNSLKPSNVLFKDTNLSRVAIGDFSKIENQLAAALPHSCLLFRSPIDDNHSRSGNVYSLALMACCILLRRLPDTSAEILNCFIPSLTTYPDRYQIICKALSMKSTLRPTAIEFMEGFDSQANLDKAEGSRWLSRFCKRARRRLRLGSQPEVRKKSMKFTVSQFAKRLSVKFDSVAVRRWRHKRSASCFAEDR